MTLQLSELTEDIDALTQSNSESLLNHHASNAPRGSAMAVQSGTASQQTAGASSSSSSHNDGIHRMQRPIDISSSHRVPTISHYSGNKFLSDIERDTVEELVSTGNSSRSKTAEGKSGLAAYNTTTGANRNVS
jgi:hypothetical protein